MPTLLEPGMVIGEEKSNERAIDYIIRQLDSKIPHDGLFPRGVKKASDRFMVLESGTGSGKSTTLPPEIFLKFEKHLRGRIAVTQPRIINTIQISESIPKFYPQIVFGEKIGYSTGFIKRRPKMATSILYMTLPTIYNQILNMTEKKFLEKYSFIIIDEVHERSTETDLTLKILKNFVNKHWKDVNCPNIIAMSATFDYARFSKYFGGCQVVRVKGEDGFAIKEMWPDATPSDVSAYCYDTAIKLHERVGKPTDDDNILIFLHKTKDILAMVKRFDEYNSARPKAGYIASIPLTSALFKEGIKTLNMKPKNIEFEVSGKKVRASRKVIIATPLAETGVTFRDLRFVIDSGYYNSVTFSSITGATLVVTAPVTQGMSRQRRGRIGRVAPGEFWPAYTKETFTAMQENQYSDLIRDEITLGIMSVISQDQHLDDDKWVGDPRDIFAEFSGLLDAPSSTSVYYSLEKLLLLGFIDTKLRPTRLGLVGRNFSKIGIEYVRAILASYWTEATPMALVNIAAIFSQRSFMGRKVKPIPGLDEDLIQCDMIKALLYFEMFLLEIEKSKKLSFDKLQKWCDDNQLMFNTLLDIMLIRDEIIETMVKFGFDPFTSQFGRSSKGRAFMLIESMKNSKQFVSEVKRIKQALFEGFKLLTFRTLPGTNKHRCMNRPVELMVDKHCAYFITNGITLRAGQFWPNAISVLDGFVDVDDHLFII